MVRKRRNWRKKTCFCRLAQGLVETQDKTIKSKNWHESPISSASPGPTLFTHSPYTFLKEPSEFVRPHLLDHQFLDLSKWQHSISHFKPTHQAIAFINGLSTLKKVMQPSRWLALNWKGCQTPINGSSHHCLRCAACSGFVRAIAAILRGTDEWKWKADLYLRSSSWMGCCRMQSLWTRENCNANHQFNIHQNWPGSRFKRLCQKLYLYIHWAKWGIFKMPARLWKLENQPVVTTFTMITSLKAAKARTKINNLNQILFLN